VEARHDLRGAEGKAAAAEEIADVLAGIAGPIEQDYYIQQAAHMLTTDDGAVRQLVRRRRHGGTAPAAPKPEPIQDVQGDSDDDYLLALLMRQRELAGQITTDQEVEFTLPESRALFRSFGNGVPEELEPFAERARGWLPVVRELSAAQLAAAITAKHMEIQRKKLEQERRALHAEIRAQREDGSESDFSGPLTQLAQRMGELDQLPPERERAGTR